MTIVSISDTEWYPVPTFERVAAGESSFHGWVCDVPEEVLKEYETAATHFNEAANKLDEFRKRAITERAKTDPDILVPRVITTTATK